ncbi:MAG: hypothetical protein H7Y42_08405 [Chitinophagaceae bacterium]|nr:hypothetical protein [Chitinophagaceae bacterium]
MIDKIPSLVLIVVLTILSGFADAQGFVHAASIWQGGKIEWSQLAKSALGFAIGISLYWIVLRSMQELNIVAPEIQTLVWFAVTMVGVAIVSGNILKWQLIDQAIAVMVLFGVGWLLIRTQS